MNKVNVKICVCAGCVMTGAIDIMNGIESLKKIDKSSGSQIKITTTPSLSEHIHEINSPVVYINEEMIENANSQTVMSKILSSLK